MRNDFTPQVETREISDDDLDNVSGGLLGPVAGALWTVDSVLPSLSDVTGLASGVTGINTAPVTSIVGL